MINRRSMLKLIAGVVAGLSSKIAPAKAAAVPVPQPEACYASVRYVGMGPIMRVRDGDTNDEFDVYNTVDLAAYSDLYCVAWYDQTGNNPPLVQAQPENQPRVILGERPSLEFESGGIASMEVRSS